MDTLTEKVGTAFLAVIVVVLVAAVCCPVYNWLLNVKYQTNSDSIVVIDPWLVTHFSVMLQVSD